MILQKNQNGSAFIGLILAVLVLAVIFGSFYFVGNTNKTNEETNPNNQGNIIDTLNNAKSDIAEINNKTEERNEEMKEPEDKKAQATAENGGIKIFDIAADSVIESPIKIEGEGRAENGILIVELRDTEHNVKVKEEVTIKAKAGETGPFAITLYFQFSNTKEGFIAVYEEGTENIVEIPVKFGTEEED